MSFSFFGFGLIRLWLLALQSFPGQKLWPDSPGDILLLRAVQVVSLVAIALLARKIRTLHRSGPVVIGSAALMTVGAGLVALSPLAAWGGWLYLAGSVFCGVGYSAMFLLWLELYGCLSSERMVVAYAGSNLVAAALWQLLSTLSGLPLAILLLIIPALSCMFLVTAFHKPEAQRSELLESSDASFPLLHREWKLFVWIACFSFSAGFFTVGGGSGIMLAFIFTGGVILIGVAVLNKRFDSSLLYRLALPFIVIGLVVAPLIGADSPFIRMAVSTGKEFTLTIAFVVVCNVSYRRKVSAAFLGGILAATNMAALTLGNILRWHANGLEDIFGLAPSTFIVALCLVCCVAATFIYTERDFSAQWDETSLRQHLGAGAASEYAEAMERVAAEYRLSEREEDIISLLFEGLTSAEIGTELFISPGTVRAHVSRIYAKFDVHSKDELLAKFEELGVPMTSGR